MKATMGTMYRSLAAQITSAGLRMQDLQNIAASGKKLNKPSDDPAAIGPVLDTRAQIHSNDQYLKTMGTAQDQMQTVDSYMDNVENILTHVKELALNSVNGSLSDADQKTLAQQVDAARDQLFDVANAKVGGKYIFSGYAEGTQPFEKKADGTVSSYKGDANPTMLEISPGETIQVSLTGNELFSGDSNNDGSTDTGKVDIFNVLTQISDAMRSNDPSTVQAQLDTIDQASDQSEMLRGKIGNNAALVQTSMDQMQGTQTDLQQTLSRYQDADLAQVLTELTQQQTAYQAALKVTAQVSQLSILDYM